MATQTEMPPCPDGVRVAAVMWLLTKRRKDDGRKGVCRYVVYCRDHGAWWQWSDRPDDGWQPDGEATELLSKRVSSNSDTT